MADIAMMEKVIKSSGSGHTAAMGFTVLDGDGNDVTGQKQWFIGTDGSLYMFDGFLRHADEGYQWLPEW